MNPDTNPPTPHQSEPWMEPTHVVLFFDDGPNRTKGISNIAVETDAQSFAWAKVQNYGKFFRVARIIHS